jgi:flagellar assembly protein FliH
MTAPAKYLFEADFGAARAQASDAASKLAAEAEARGYRAGYAAAAAEQSRQHADALDRIAIALTGLGETLCAMEQRLQIEVVNVAVAIARKLCPELIAREPIAEITALVGDCFRHLIGVPHVVVRVNEAVYASVRDEIEALARARGLESRLVVLAQNEVAPGDCRIEWADGGISRDLAKTEAAIVQAVNNYLAARPAAASSHGDSVR